MIDPRYLAGVIDSDGSISISILHKKRPKPTYRALLQLTWTKTEKTKRFFELLVSQYGGSFSICKSSSNSGFANSTDYFKYSAAGKAGEAICRDIQPFLFLKDEQAKNFLKLREIMRSSKDMKLLESLYLLNKTMNRKNRRNDA